MWAEKRGKLLALVIALTAMPNLFLFFSLVYQDVLNVVNGCFLSSMIFGSIYLITSIGVISYCGIKTAKAAKNYQPPAGSSNAAESVEKMKCFHILTVSVLILNSAYTLFLLINYLELVPIGICAILYQKSRTGGNFQGTSCQFWQDILLFANYYAWMPALSIFTSNGGLLFHCIFSQSYRNEAKKVFHEFVGIIRGKHSTAVVPMHASISASELEMASGRAGPGRAGPGRAGL
jgi:hypothetical protein